MVADRGGMMAHKQWEFGHVTKSTYSSNANSSTTMKQYTPHPLPERPAQGSAMAKIVCSECHNTYRLRVDSRGRYFIISTIKWFVFPLLVLGTMIVPAMVGSPNSWVIFFSIALISWAFFSYGTGSHGYGRIKRVGKRVAKYAQHRLFSVRES